MTQLPSAKHTDDTMTFWPWKAALSIVRLGPPYPVLPTVTRSGSQAPAIWGVPLAGDEKVWTVIFCMQSHVLHHWTITLFATGSWSSWPVNFNTCVFSSWHDMKQLNRSMKKLCAYSELLRADLHRQQIATQAWGASSLHLCNAVDSVL